MPPTKLHSTPSLDILSMSTEESLELPLISENLSAGFPSPAMDFVDVGIDFNKHIIKHPSATYYGRVKGDSMKDAGIHDGDLLVIDRSLKPTNGKIAVCFIDGDFTVKRIKIEQDCLWLVAENEMYAPIKVTSDNHFLIWGIISHVIKSF